MFSDRQLHHHLLIRPEIQIHRAEFAGIPAGGYGIRNVVDLFMQIEANSDVVRLNFVFAIVYEEVVAVDWNSKIDFF